MILMNDDIQKAELDLGRVPWLWPSLLSPHGVAAAEGRGPGIPWDEDNLARAKTDPRYA